MNPTDRISGRTMAELEAEGRLNAIKLHVDDNFDALERERDLADLQNWRDNLGPDGGFEWLASYDTEELLPFFKFSDCAPEFDRSKWHAACTWVVEDRHGSRYTWHLSQMHALEEAMRWERVWDEAVNAVRV